MKRMRKSKPTMAMYVSAGLPLVPLSPLVPLGNCPNVPSPCGHCWYCEQRKQAVAK